LKKEDEGEGRGTNVKRVKEAEEGSETHLGGFPSKDDVRSADLPSKDREASPEEEASWPSPEAEGLPLRRPLLLVSLVGLLVAVVQLSLSTSLKNLINFLKKINEVLF
jgi:hypothetical protein